MQPSGFGTAAITAVLCPGCGTRAVIRRIEAACTGTPPDVSLIETIESHVWVTRTGQEPRKVARAASSEGATDPGGRKGTGRSSLRCGGWARRRIVCALVGAIEHYPICEPVHRVVISGRWRSEGVEEECAKHGADEEQRPVESSDVLGLSSRPARPASGGHLVLLSQVGHLQRISICSSRVVRTAAAGVI